MQRVVRTVFLAASVMFVALSANGDDLSDAVDAFLKEDYSQIDTIARYADDGVPEAIALLGRAYIYGNGLEIDRPLGLALLEQSASLGDRASAVQLGRIYEFGIEGIAPDEALAAKWYVVAANAGDTASAPAALKRLPAAIVIEAGGGSWANPDTLDERPSEQAPLKAVDNTPPAMALASPDGPSPGAQQDSTASPASVILGTDKAPAPLSLLDRTSFPIFADTRLSAIGDAAASCQVVLQPEIERRQSTFDGMMQLGNDASTEKTGVGYDKLLENERELKAMTEALQASERILADLSQNGGLSPDAVRLAQIPHQEAFVSRPDTGPSAALCGRRFIQLVGESAGWGAK
ncbi:hypothetical protein WNY37_07030 [Henriciella sp. AS95]|uniref:tetratricopeptide repeat protein n=1 Tax=Henriciella sp. AS95 TaxID=3135782 RepID=UPI00317E93D1